MLHYHTFNYMSKLTSIPLALPKNLHGEIKRGAKKTGLSQAAVMRSSMKLGLPLLVQSFQMPVLRQKRTAAKVSKK